ncbi:MAG: alanine--tRNA ligase [Candidatus Omnitrophota bacterium]
MTGHEIRSKYLEFFKSKGHKVIASDSLVPKDDPTVLFTTAGMQQFKLQFMGHITDFTRATTSQKCLRTDDLTEVGVTDFHHTMFEMLGNFSFGDYFKREAITWGWEFLTRVMAIPAEKLWVSVNQDDDEAYQIWLNEVKLPAERIVKLGDKSNFWPSNARVNGPNGPCGPCSEIFFDWGFNNCKNPDCNPDCNCGRFCEIWNLVFTQYNRKDGGVLEPLPAKNIDTGMGLERLTAVMQGKHNNFESDLFTPIMTVITQTLAAEDVNIPLRETRIITDHARAVTFGLNDGVVPSNEGRGYVMRKLIVDMTNILLQAGIKKPLVHTFIPAVVDVMKGPYPELVGKQKDIAETVKRVEEAVIKVNGEKVPEFISELERLKASGMAIPEKLGEIMFRYRDTYGLPLSLIESKVGDHFGRDIAVPAYAVAEKLMEQQKERSRAGSKMQGDVFLSGNVDVKGIAKTIFIGYAQPACEAVILKLFVNGQAVAEANEGDLVTIVLDKTPFYAEQGGQCADIGVIAGKTGAVEITDTQKMTDVYTHNGSVIKGTVKVNDNVKASIDGEQRMAVARNHSATHLLQASLRIVLGEHVKQQGSLVDALRLRFDFTHPKGVSRDELDKIEDAVNSFIRACEIVSKNEMTLEEAKESGALAFFAEKYGEKVRVIGIGDISKEFCGGTHLDSTGQIGLFKIISEGAVAQGIRRIEAVTGVGALNQVRSREKLIEKAALALKASPDDLVLRVEQQAKRIKELQKEVSALNFDLIRFELDEIIAKAETIKDVCCVAHVFKDVDMDTLRRVSDLVKQKCPTSVQILGAANGVNEAALLVTVSDDLVLRQINAGKIIQKLAPMIDGSGGGRPNMAQAGGRAPDKLTATIEQAKSLVKGLIL